MLAETKIETPSTLPGTRSDFSRPMILELIANNQGEEVFKLLYAVNLEVKEVSRKPGFQISQRR